MIGIMEVSLLGAKSLRNTEFFGGGIDPYVLIQYKSHERKSSVARGQGSSPVWNEKFKFRVQYPSADNQYKLLLKLMDQDTFSADDYLGQAVIYLKDLFEQAMENGKAELRAAKYSVVCTDKSYCGEIQVGITFTPIEERSCDEDYGGWKESE